MWVEDSEKSYVKDQKTLNVHVSVQINIPPCKIWRMETKYAGKIEGMRLIEKENEDEGADGGGGNVSIYKP